MNTKLKIAVIFGGKSSEHEVSLMSATSVMNAMDKEKYEIIPIGITKKGQWMLYDGPIDQIETGEWEDIAREKIKKDPKKYDFYIVPMGQQAKTAKSLKELADVVFPILHGPLGEDGTIQGLFEMADVAYVGTGVLASSVGMDKIYTKKVFEQEKLPIGKYMVVMRKKLREDQEACLKEIEEKFAYPIFIKPANLGSSVGISKVHDRKELISGLLKAAKHDRKILIEAFIKGREIECAVLGNDEVKASIPGEILPSHEFYDYDAKYFDDGKSKMIIPANLPEDVIKRIREIAVKAYKSIDCTGLSRVDCFFDEENDRIYINEINTMPGFTKFSMYPLLWQETGIPYTKLIDELIKLAIERYEDR